MLGFHRKDINRTTDRQTRPNLLRTCLQLNSLHENSHSYRYFNKIESAQLRLRMSAAGDTQSSYIIHTSNVSSYRMRDAPKRVVGVELESIVLFVTRTFVYCTQAKEAPRRRTDRCIDTRVEKRPTSESRQNIHYEHRHRMKECLGQESNACDGNITATLEDYEASTPAKREEART